MKILAAGYFGEGNAGDDALVRGLVTIATEVDPDVQITVTWGGRSPSELKNVRLIPRALHEVQGAVGEHDALILGPGGILHNARLSGNWHSDRGLAYYDAVTSSAALLGLPIAAVGIGIGPLHGPTARRLALRILERCQTVTVRDAASLEAARTVGFAEASPVADLAFANEPADPPLASDSGGVLGVTLRPWQSSRASDSLLDNIAGAVRELVAAGLVRKVIGIPLSQTESGATDDRGPITSLFERLGTDVHTDMARPEGLDIYESLISDVDVLVTMRLHGMVFAANVGTRTVGLAYTEKVEAMGNVLGVTTLPTTSKTSDIVHAVTESMQKPPPRPPIHDRDIERSQLLALEGARSTEDNSVGIPRRTIESLLVALRV